VGEAKRGRCKTRAKSESWRTLPLTKRSLRLITLKEFLKVLAGILTPIPLRRSGLSFLITLADKSIILPVGDFGLIGILFGLTVRSWKNG
jgi:hypothetical protein